MTDSTHEHSIREAFDAGQLDAAACGALKAYRDEIFSFIASRLHSRSDAQEAFSMFAEDLWVGLPKFHWQCSLRTWCYALARNAATRYATAPQQRAARNVPLTRSGVMSELVDQMRSATHLYQNTGVKDHFRNLREKLDVEDQTLLVLRVDRGMSWRDLAIAMSGNIDGDDAAIDREAARLRKAFERVKLELRKLAESEGLLAPKD